MIKFKTINAGYDYGYKVWDKIEQVLLKAQEQEKENQILKDGFLGLKFALENGYTDDDHQEAIDKVNKMLEVLEVE